MTNRHQRVIIGLSDCSLPFPIGTFHTNSFLCHPFDCKEVVCFWTLQYFRYVMIVGALWWCWCIPAAAAVGVCSGVTTLPLLPTSAVLLCGHLRRQGSGPGLCLRQPRRLGQQWLAPAAAAVGVGGGGATPPAPLPPTSMA